MGAGGIMELNGGETMQIKVKTKHLELTDALKDYAQKKFSRIERYFDQVLSADVMLCTERNTHIAEVTVHVNGNVLRGEERTDNMYASIDKVLEKLERQIHKIKEKKRNHHMKQESSELPPQIEALMEIHEQPVHPFHPIDAAKELDRLEAPFYLFVNQESGELNLIHRNGNRKLRLIVPKR